MSHSCIWVIVYPPAQAETEDLSHHGCGGNLVEQISSCLEKARLINELDRKFESSPGHHLQIYLVFQSLITDAEFNWDHAMGPRFCPPRRSKSFDRAPILFVLRFTFTEP